MAGKELFGLMSWVGNEVKVKSPPASRMEVSGLFFYRDGIVLRILLCCRSKQLRRLS